MRKKITFLVLTLVCSFGLILGPQTTSAGLFDFNLDMSTLIQTIASQQSVVTLTFDDGRKSVYTHARPVLDDYELTATAYVYTKSLDRGWRGFMNWQELKDLQDKSGWEIGSHSKTHPRLTWLPYNEMVSEVRDSKIKLEEMGLTIKSFSTPYGDYNHQVLTEISKYYSSHRAAWGGVESFDKYNDYNLKPKSVYHNTTPEEVKQWLEDAKNNRQWLILIFHDIVDGQPGPYQYGFDDFKEIIKDIKESGLPVRNISQVVEQWDTKPNLIANSGFDQGQGEDADDWKRNSNQGIAVDNDLNGVYPGPERSVCFTGGEQEKKIYTTKLFDVQHSNQYVLRTWQNIPEFTQGYLSYWVSEHDADGNYIGGKWLGGTSKKFIGVKYLDYTPKNEQVDVVSLSIYTHSGSILEAYVDEIRLYLK